MRALYVFGIVVAVAAFANCAPLFDDQLEKLFAKFKVDCGEKFNCPEGSTSCSRNTTTSADRKTITTEIKCFSADGQQLNNGNGVKSEPNKGNGIYNTYEYYGSFSGGSNTVHTTNYGNSSPDVETFEK